MKHSHMDQITKENVSAFGSEKTTVQWWTNQDDSQFFMMRRFEIGPHGHIGIHGHPEEHQMFVLKGPIILLDHDGNETEVGSNEFVFMPSEEKHGYKNPNEYSVSFICCIPNLKK